jgi:hypothetical protein
MATITLLMVVDRGCRAVQVALGPVHRQERHEDRKWTEHFPPKFYLCNSRFQCGSSVSRLTTAPVRR